MPGALAYTDGTEHRPLQQPLRRDVSACRRTVRARGPYPAFLRYLAEHGYYGDGDVDALVASAWRACAIPPGRRSRTARPTVTCIAVLRRRAGAGGTVTVITDITDFKRAEEDLARKEAALQAALDNMPGALAYTDEDLTSSCCNQRFAEMYPVPRELLEPGQPVSGVPALSRTTRLLRRRRRRCR